MGRPLDAPAVIGSRFHLKERLGEGERKRVFRAWDSDMEVPVALSLIQANDEEIALTQREKQVTARLRSSPNVVTIYDAGQDADWCFIVSEFMEGGDLGSLLDQAHANDEHLPVLRVLEIARDVAVGLVSTHGQGILHLDVQPNNVWFDRPDGSAYLGDFDLAVTLDEAVAAVPLGPVTTAGYMAPEEVAGGACDERTDLYSFGATLYHALSGAPPFSGSDQEVREQHVKSEPVPVSDHRDGVSIPLELLIGQLLKKKPEDRPGSASAVLQALEAVTVQESDQPFDLDREIEQGESQTLEFKASFKTPVGSEQPKSDQHRQAILKEIEISTAKTLAAFMNSGGGTLLLGVLDSGETLGIESDYPSVGRKQDSDGWELHFRKLMWNRLGRDAALAISVRFFMRDDRTIAVVRCKRRSEPTFMVDGDDEKFFVRYGNATEQLSPGEQAKYINREWPNQL